MDLIYMSDVMAYQSIRSPIYDRYEQRWDQPNSKGEFISIYTIVKKHLNFNQQSVDLMHIEWFCQYRLGWFQYIKIHINNIVNES